MDIINTISTQSWTDIFINGRDWMLAQFANNDFLIGIIVPLILGWLAYTGKGIAGSIITYIKLLTTSEITVNSDNTYYHDISEYLYKHSVSKIFQRFFILTYSWRWEHMELTVGYGSSIGFIGGWPVIIKRTIEESQSSKFKEIINIIIIGGRHKVLSTLVSAANDIVVKDNDSNMTNIYKIDKGGDATSIAKKPYRNLDTIIIPQKDKDYIIDKLDEFVRNEEKYKKMGLPYHLGIILSGPPGTGKTSLIHAIASYLKRNIYFQMGSTIEVGYLDTDKAILVIEDIDANGMQVKTRADGSPNAIMDAISDSSMSSILNTLDGLLSPHGLITIATTNHYDKLDDAIVRPGRFDVHLKFTHMAWPEWLGMCELLDHKSPITEEQYCMVSPAQVRYILLYYTDAEIVKYFEKEMIDSSQQLLK